MGIKVNAHCLGVYFAKINGERPGSIRTCQPHRFAEERANGHANKNIVCRENEH